MVSNAGECKSVKIGFNNEVFYVKVCGKSVARLLYRIEGDIFHLVSTYTLKAFKGKGLASKVVRKALNYALSRGFRKLKVSCSFVEGWLEKNSEFKGEFEEVVFV